MQQQPCGKAVSLCLVINIAKCQHEGAPTIMMKKWEPGGSRPALGQIPCQPLRELDLPMSALWLSVWPVVPHCSLENSLLN